MIPADDGAQPPPPAQREVPVVPRLALNERKTRSGSALSAALNLAWERRRKAARAPEKVEAIRKNRRNGGLAGKAKGAATLAARAQNLPRTRPCFLCHTLTPGTTCSIALCYLCAEEWPQVMRAAGVQGLPPRSPGVENGTLP